MDLAGSRGSRAFLLIFRFSKMQWPCFDPKMREVLVPGVSYFCTSLLLPLVASRSRLCLVLVEILWDG